MYCSYKICILCISKWRLFNKIKSKYLTWFTRPYMTLSVITHCYGKCLIKLPSALLLIFLGANSTSNQDATRAGSRLQMVPLVHMERWLSIALFLASFPALFEPRLESFTVAVSKLCIISAASGTDGGQWRPSLITHRNVLTCFSPPVYTQCIRKPGIYSSEGQVEDFNALFCWYLRTPWWTNGWPVFTC